MEMLLDKMLRWDVRKRRRKHRFFYGCKPCSNPTKIMQDGICKSRWMDDWIIVDSSTNRIGLGISLGPEQTERALEQCCLALAVLAALRAATTNLCSDFIALLLEKGEESTDFSTVVGHVQILQKLCRMESASQDGWMIG
jgi:hypothetical protein